jgi:glyoxylase-like metal-dependent hydrolase (beta-lactamase superfamily II)
MSHANPGIHSIKVGEAVITAMNDGQFDADTAWVTGLTAPEATAMLQESFRVLPPRITVSCFFLQIAGRNVVVDFGGGAAMGHLIGHAGERLAALGVDPKSIDTILVTHAHVDHVHGLVTAGGEAVFPNAELVINAAETAFWFDKEIEAKAPESAKMYFGIAQRALDPYAKRMRLIGDGEEVFSGVTAVHLPGHTPGHTGWRVDSGSQTLLIWGDIVHLPGLQFARPEAGMAFDIDGELGRATRARALDMVATDKLLLTGMHLDFPTFGHVRRAGTGYAFEPMVWAPTESGLFAKA